MGDKCVVCRRRDPDGGAVCTPDRERMALQLGELLRAIGQIEAHLIPGAGGGGEKVRTSPPGSRIPGRLDTLSALGPGAATVPAVLHPLVRHWSTRRAVTVRTLVGDRWVETQRDVVEWHSDTARHPDGSPVFVADDDQVGVLPPREWIAAEAAGWRRLFGHATPPPPAAVTDPARARAALRHAVLAAAAGRPGAATVATVSGVQREIAYRRWAADTMLGLNTTTGDPTGDEWDIRFGRSTPNAATIRDVKYLLTWLPKACDEHRSIADFAAELRTMVAEMTRVLGERPDQQWLGRCPAVLRDADTDDGGVVCGAGLWQDPFAAQVMCPRCHSTWGPRMPELLHLAAEIRRVWPVDRRRRYDADEIDHIPAITCTGCGEVVHIEWRDVTALSDDRRWWRPDTLTCPTGCPDPERNHP